MQSAIPRLGSLTRWFLIAGTSNGKLKRRCYFLNPTYLRALLPGGMILIVGRQGVDAFLDICL